MKSSRPVMLATLAALIGTATAFAQIDLNKLKKAVDDVAETVDEFTFSEAEEIELGRAISKRIRKHYGVAQDPDVTRYISLVGTMVAQKSTRPSIPWRWVVLDSDVVNAFAAPGGYVHVTRGALRVIDSEAELAGVLAHEAAHVTQKHTLKAQQKARGMELAQEKTAFKAGSALFEEVADKAAEAVLAGFSQTEELEADQVGVEIAARAGYGAYGLTEFLETLKACSSEPGFSPSVLFRSHPDIDDRIKKLPETEKSRRDDRDKLAERYLAFVSYSTQDDASPTEELAETKKQGEHKYSLANLADPSAMGEKDESAEVTGAGAGRGVCPELAEDQGGDKNAKVVRIKLTPKEVAAFQKEGGLK